MSPTYPTIGATVPGSDEVGELVLERVLGAGAFGIVFQARATKSGAPVAAKFLQAGVLATPHERQALFNEILPAREIERPHVPRERYRTPFRTQPLDFSGGRSEFFGGGAFSRDNMKPYPLADDLLRPVSRVVMPLPDARDPRWTTRRAVGNATFLARSLPPRRRRMMPVSPQVQGLGG